MLLGMFGKKTSKIESFEDAMKVLREVDSVTVREEINSHKKTVEEKISDFYVTIEEDIKKNFVEKVSAKNYSSSGKVTFRLGLSNDYLDQFTCFDDKFFKNMEEHLKNRFIGYDAKFRFEFGYEESNKYGRDYYTIKFIVHYIFSTFSNLSGPCENFSEQLVEFDWMCMSRDIGIGDELWIMDGKLNSEV